MGDQLPFPKICTNQGIEENGWCFLTIYRIGGGGVER